LLLIPVFVIAAPVPKPEKDETKLLVTANGGVTLMAPDGTGAKVVIKGGADEYAYKAWLSPDRKRVAYVYKERPDDRTGKAMLGVKTIDGEPVMKVEMRSPNALFWSADGKNLVGTLNDDRGIKGNDLGYRSWRMDAVTGVKTSLDLPGDCVLVAPVPNSDKVACLRHTYTQPLGPREGFKVETELLTTDPDKFAPTTVIETVSTWPPVAVFPDGKRWLRHSSGEVGVHTVGEKEPKKWKRDPYVSEIALRPDGKRVAFAFFEWKKELKDTRWELWTADPDGTNAVKVLTRDDDKYLSHIDWR
jgi:hypothetical protein